MTSPLGEAVTAASAQQLQLLLGLDALGDDRKVGGAADRERGLDDAALAVARRAGDEAAVELDPGQREPREPRQRRIAGPEVVEVDPHAQRGERLEAADRRLAALDEPRLAELARGDVDADAQAGRPQRRLGAGLAQHPVADLGDQPAVLLGGGQEAARREQAVLGVLPADQGLDGHDAAVLEVDDRLVVQPQLILGQRAAQALLDPDPVAQAPAHRAVEDLVGPAATGLHAVHGGVGVLQQALPALVLDGDPDRRRQPVGQRQPEPLGERRRLALVLELGEHRELVAAEARQRLRDVELLLQALGDLAQHVVARAVSVRVVDRAEAVEADQEHREAAAQRPRERLFEPFLEQAPVREPGQRVVQRLMDEPLVQAPRLGEVDDREDEPLDLALRGAAAGSWPRRGRWRRRGA